MAELVPLILAEVTLDVLKISMSAVSFLGQLDSELLCQHNAFL